MHQLHQFISVLNSSLKSGNLFFRTTKTKFILQVVHLLMKHQYFTGYKACVNNPSHIIIFFKLMPGCQQSLLVKCTLATNSSCPRYFRWSQLHNSNLSLNSGLLVLTTTQGLMTQKEAYSNRIGGQILLKII